MNSHIKSLATIRFFDELAQKNTFVHSIHPLVKLIITLLYIVAVVSCDKYALSKLLPLALYPFILIPIAEIPTGAIFKRTLVVLPFIAGIGIMNPVFDKTAMAVIFNVQVSGGWISFITLLLKSGLTIFGALILFSTTGIEKIGYALRMLRIPKLIVLQMLLTFRYISLFNVVISRITNAYFLRAPEHKGIAVKAWGPLAGQLLLRTFDTGQKVYEAMALRGFSGEYHPGGNLGFSIRDLLYALAWTLFFSVSFFFDIPQLIGNVVTGGRY